MVLMPAFLSKPSSKQEQHAVFTTLQQNFRTGRAVDDQLFHFLVHNQQLIDSHASGITGIARTPRSPCLCTGEPARHCPEILITCLEEVRASPIGNRYN